MMTLMQLLQYHIPTIGIIRSNYLSFCFVLTTCETKTTFIIAARVSPRVLYLLVHFIYAALIIVVVFQIPHWWPTVLTQILLIIQVQRSQSLD